MHRADRLPSRNSWSISIVLALIFISGCLMDPPSGKGPATTTTTNPAAPVDVPVTPEGTPKVLQKVSLALNWYPEMEHGGYYAAMLHGYYREAGLDVEIIPGGPSAPVGPKVDGGQATFGIENADRVLLLRAGGAKVVALMAPIQTSPRCVLVHEESGIRTLNELKDVTLAMTPGAPWAVFLKKAVRLDEKNVQIVPSPGSMALFVEKKDFARQGYVFSEPFVAEELGAKVRSLMVSDLGFNPYTSVLIATEDRTTQDADTVRAMVTASLRGWRKYLEDPAETHAKLAELNSEMTSVVLTKGFAAMKPLCVPDGQDPPPLGSMTLERWKVLAEQLVDTGIIEKESADPAAAFREEFLKSP